MKLAYDEFDVSEAGSRLSVQERLMGPLKDLTRTRGEALYTEDKILDKAEETEQEREKRTFSRRKRL